MENSTGQLFVSGPSVLPLLSSQFFVQHPSLEKPETILAKTCSIATAIIEMQCTCIPSLARPGKASLSSRSTPKKTCRRCSESGCGLGFHMSYRQQLASMAGKNIKCYNALLPEKQRISPIWWAEAPRIWSLRSRQASDVPFPSHSCSPTPLVSLQNHVGQ